MAINYQKKLVEVQTIYSEFQVHSSVEGYVLSPPSISYREQHKRTFAETLKLLAQVDELALMLLQDLRPAFLIPVDPGIHPIFIHPVGAHFLGMDLEYLLRIVLKRTPIMGTPSIFAQAIFSTLSVVITRSSIPQWENIFIHCKTNSLTPDAANSLNFLMIELRKSLLDKNTKASLYRQTSSTNQKFQSCCDYLDALLIHHEELFVFAMGFWVLDPLYLTDKTNSYQQLLSKLLGNGRKHQALNMLVGHIGKWEHNPEKGSYARIVFFIPVTDVMDKRATIDGIGMYWINQVCKGNGAYIHSKLVAKQAKLKAKYCSISVKDEKLVDDFKNIVISYLTKSDNYFLSSWLVSGPPQNTNQQNLQPNLSPPHVTQYDGAPRLTLEEFHKSSFPESEGTDMPTDREPEKLDLPEIEPPGKASPETEHTITLEQNINFSPMATPFSSQDNKSSRLFKNIFFRGEMPK